MNAPLARIRGAIEARRHVGLRHDAVARLIAVAAWLIFCGTVAAQPAPAPARPPAERSQTGAVIRLNKGIWAFQQGRIPEACRELEQALAESEPNNAACLYFLGLARLREGLAASGAKDYKNAQAAFEKARVCFQALVRSTDPTVRPLEAALNLGIAQLAVDQPDIDKSYQLNREAARTLQEYIEQTAEGGRDRFGHFYLGIADYRIAVSESSGPQARSSDRSRKETIRLLEMARKQFGEAVRIASTELKTAPSDELRDAIKRFNSVVSYYQGLIDLARDNATNNVTASKTLAGLRRVAKENPGESFGIQAADLVQIIEAALKKRPIAQAIPVPPPIGPLQLDGSVALGPTFDNNVILLGQDTILPRGIPHKYDWNFGLSTGFDLRRVLDEKYDHLAFGKSLTLGIGGTTQHVWQPSVKEFDINNYSGRAYANWEAIPDLFFGVQYDYGYTQLGHKPFISSNRVTPVITKLWRDAPSKAGEKGEERGRTDFYYIYDDRNYLDRLGDPGFDRDGNYHTVGFGQSFNLVKAGALWKDYYGRGTANKLVDHNDGNRWLIARVGYAYRNERTQGDEFDLYGNTVGGGLEIPLPYRFGVELAGDFTWDHYTQPSLIDFRHNQRFDFIQHYVVALSRILVDRGESPTLSTLRVRARAGVEWTFQDSNIWDRTSEDVYSYDRVVYGLQLLIDF